MHPEIDRFAHLESPIHRWDPRWKLATLLLLMLSFGMDAGGAVTRDYVLHGLGPPLASLAVSLGLLFLSRIPAGFVLRRLRPVAAFLAILLVVLPLTYPGGTPWVGPFTFSTRGLLVAAAMVVRAMAIVVLVFPAFGTSRFDVSMKALRRLGVPASFVAIVLFTYRYLFVYADQVRKLNNALRARGFRPGTNLRTLRTVGNSIGVLLVGSIERTQRIQGAMKCRGFSGTFRTLDDFATRWSDVALCAIVLLAGALLMTWRLSRW